jgi:hypothetical protein
MDAAVANAATQATGLATTFQTPLAIFIGIVLFSIACAITFAMIKRSHGATEEKGLKAGRDYEYIWKDGRIAGAQKTKR